MVFNYDFENPSHNIDCLGNSFENGFETPSWLRPLTNEEEMEYQRLAACPPAVSGAEKFVERVNNVQETKGQLSEKEKEEVVVDNVVPLRLRPKTPWQELRDSVKAALKQYKKRM